MRGRRNAGRNGELNAVRNAELIRDRCKNLKKREFFYKKDFYKKIFYDILPSVFLLGFGKISVLTPVYGERAGMESIDYEAY